MFADEDFQGQRVDVTKEGLSNKLTLTYLSGLQMDGRASSTRLVEAGVLLPASLSAYASSCAR